MTTNDEQLAGFYDDFDRDPNSPKPQPGDHPGIKRELWGLFPDVDIAAYHRDELAPEPSLSNSGMKRLIAETPLDFAYHHPRINPEAVKEADDTAAKRRGDVVHQLALGKGRGYAVLPFDDFRSTAAKSARDNAVADGLTPIKQKDFDEAEVMAEVLRERIEEYLDGAAYQTEVAFIYQHMTAAGPIWCRGLMDVWCEERLIILDPKVTARLYDDSVGRHMVDMGWDRQAAFYPHAVGEILGQGGRVKFRDLMVKPEAPYTSRVVGLEKSDEYQAILECRSAMERFGAGMYSGNWPGFGNETHFVDLPAWTRKSREERYGTGAQ